MNQVLWASWVALRAVTFNLGALFICDRILSGFTIDGLQSYLWAAVGLELPTIIFLWGVTWLIEVGDSTVETLDDRGRFVQAVAIASMLGVLVTPLVLSTCLPGLLLAELLSPTMSIDGFWTYVGACVITATTLLLCRQLRSFNFLRDVVRQTPEERARRWLLEAGNDEAPE